jgi:hypothetical protein
VHKVIEMHIVDTLEEEKREDNNPLPEIKAKLSKWLSTWLMSEIQAALSCMLGATRWTTLPGPLPDLFSTII